MLAIAVMIVFWRVVMAMVLVRAIAFEAETPAEAKIGIREIGGLSSEWDTA
jgi:hypothetical protein